MASGIRLNDSASKKGNQIQVCVSLPPELLNRIRELSAETMVPMARYFRRALEEYLDREDAAAKQLGLASRRLAAAPLSKRGKRG